MMDGLKGATINALLTKLHDAILTFADNVDVIIEENRAIAIDDIRELRDHIMKRLEKQEEVADNRKILKLLDLFSKDKAVLEIIREDAEEWVKLLEGIEGNIRSRGDQITEEEKEEIKEIGKLTAEIKALIRK